MQQSNFDKYSSDWWDKNGSMRMLHSMNETRMLFIKERIMKKYQELGKFKNIIKKKEILDLGCGGGILSESLAREGASLTAVDQSKKLIESARERANTFNYNINYQCSSIEEMYKKKIKFDIIICLEVIEHIYDYQKFIINIFNCLKKNGLVILSTINRSKLAYLTTIFFAEKIFKLVPNKTHDWNMYIKPEEIIELLEKKRIKTDKLIGLLPIPTLYGYKWIRIKNTNANYMISFIN